MSTYIGDIVSGEENLGNGLPIVAKEAVPQTQQTTLANGRQSLQRVQVLRTLVLVHPLQPNTDGARGHDDDFVSILTKLDSRRNN